MDYSKLNHLVAVEKLIIFLFSSFCAAIVFWSCISLTIPASYPDFVVGSITWSASTKLQDIIVVPLTILALLSTAAFLVNQFAAHKKCFGQQYTVDLSYHLFVWLVPSLIALLDYILNSRIDRLSGYFSLLGVVCLYVISVFHRYRNIKVSPATISIMLFSVFLISLFPLAIALIVGRAFPSLLSHVTTAQYVVAAGWLACCLTLVVSTLFIFLPHKVERFTPKFILIGQLSLPWFYFLLYPAKLLSISGEVNYYTTTGWLSLFLLSIIGLSLLDLINRYRKYGNNDETLLKLWSPITLFALFIGVIFAVTITPAISPDDYHFGEDVLGWWTYLNGYTAYIDFMPPHGFITNDLKMLISSMFFDGTAGSLNEVARISYTILGLIALYSIYWFSGSLLFGFIAVSALCSLDFHWLFLVPFFCVWLHPSILAKPSNWLCIWFISAPFVILAVPPQGLVMVASSGVIAAWQSYQFFLDAKPADWKKVAATLGGVMLIGILTPLGYSLFGAIRYVLENGSINQVSYGIAWSLSWHNHSLSPVALELIRMSWIVFPIISIIFFVRGYYDRNRKVNMMLTSAFMCTFVFLLIPYSMGRIDPDAPSRMGIIAVFCWAFLLPALLLGKVSKSTRAMIALVAVCFPVLIKKSPILPSNLLIAVSPSVNTVDLKQGQSEGMPNIGLAYVDPTHWQRLVALNNMLNRILEPKESYLDLSSRNAHYFYFDRLPSMAVTAPYNLVATAQQLRAIDILNQNPPRIVLLEAANITHDGGGLALRNPYLYRFVLKNYTAKRVGDFVIGFRKAKEGQAAVVSPALYDVGVKNLTDANWLNGISRTQPALIVDDATPLQLIYKGMPVRLEANDVRPIEKIWPQGRVIYFKGDLLPPVSKFAINYSSEFEREYEVGLLQSVFGNLNLHKIPVSWGRSANSLASKMLLITDLTGLLPQINDMVVHKQESITAYSIKGGDPYLMYDLALLNISGYDAGLLKLNFTCTGQSAEPLMQVFFWGDYYNAPDEAASVKFIGHNGSLIVPLDSSPRWLMTKTLKGLRIDLNNAGACESIKITDLGLYQRSDMVQ